MPNQQLAAIFLATAVWAIFAAGIIFWSPVAPTDGVRVAEQTRVVKPRGISRATASDLHR
jgi:glucose dehydrogenase